MIARIWRTAIDTDREEEYRRFEQLESLPMFRQQAGFRGVLFLRSEQGAAALTFWETEADVERLGRSATYLATVERLGQTNLLRGEQTVEVFEVAGTHFDASAWRL